MHGRLLALILTLGAAQGFAATYYGLTTANCGACTTENLLFQSSTTGLTVSGFTNQTSTQMDIAGNGTQLLHGAGGQAVVEGYDSNNTAVPYGEATFTIAGTTFGTFILNINTVAFNRNTDPIPVVLFTVNGVDYTSTFDLGSGSNFFTFLVYTDPADNTGLVPLAAVGLSSVQVRTYTSSTPSNAIQDIRQIRVGDIAAASTVPEPGTFLLMGAGCVLLGLLGRRKA